MSELENLENKLYSLLAIAEEFGFYNNIELSHEQAEEFSRVEQEYIIKRKEFIYILKELVK